MNTPNDLSIDEGSISFWIPEHSLMYTNGQSTPLVSINPNGGSIFMLKDSDNKLKVFFVALGKGRIDLEYDASEIDPNNKHMVVFTWSLSARELSLYIDGNKVSSKEAVFN